MRVLLILLSVAIQSAVFSQQKIYTPAEVQRIGDLGRIWGMLHYFHPVMATGTVNTDSLALGPIKSLLADPSAEGFKKSVQQMLGTNKYPRLRVGIDSPPPGFAGKDYVLGKYSPGEKTSVDFEVGVSNNDLN